MQIVLKIKKEKEKWIGYGHKRLEIVVRGAYLAHLEKAGENHHWKVTGAEKDGKILVEKMLRTAPRKPNSLNQSWESFKNI